MSDITKEQRETIIEQLEIMRKHTRVAFQALLYVQSVADVEQLRGLQCWRGLNLMFKAQERTAGHWIQLLKLEGESHGDLQERESSSSPGH